MPPFITNQRGYGPWITCLRALLIIGLWAAVLLPPWWALSSYARLCAQVPRAPDILAHPNTHHSVDLISSERLSLENRTRPSRVWVSIDEISPQLVMAFVAAEDAAFFGHDGVDPVSVMRAAAINWRHGEVTQGGSTITQQLAKIYVGRDQSYERKLKEAVLARRIEARYTKAQILEAYLNLIYLGAGAHGIHAAAKRYFDKTPAQLSLQESALIAGLTAAPSLYNPYINPKGASQRRSYVLQRLAAEGIITEEQAQAASDSPLGLSPPSDAQMGTPYLAQRAHSELRALQAQGALHLPSQGQVLVETSANLRLQQEAQRALRQGASTLAKHRQDRATLFHFFADEIPHLRAQAQARFGEPQVGAIYPAVVLNVEEDSASLAIGDTELTLNAAALAWLRGEIEEEQARHKSPPADTRTLLQPGDLVRVQCLAEGQAALLPAFEVQGALVSVEVDSAEIRAIAGGVGFDVTQFDRASKGCRQPGSVFKPLVFTAALERRWTTATMLYDLPVRYTDEAGRLIWEPRNADRDFRGELLLTDALVSSRNLPAVKLIMEVGVDATIRLAQRLGVEEPLARTHSLALGASCLTPLTITSVFATFASRGKRSTPKLVQSVYTREGELLFEGGDWRAPGAQVDQRLLRLLQELKAPPEQVLRPAHAYLMTYMLRQVVQRGTATKAQALGVDVAGKTGTTNLYDVWFVGFSEDLVTGVWLGDDLNQKELGEGESGGTTALPVWSQYMQAALAGRPQEDPLSHPPASIEMIRIDPNTGLLAHPKGPGRWMPFLRGSEPQLQAPGPKEKAAVAADRVDRDF